MNASAATEAEFPPEASSIDSGHNFVPEWAPRTTTALRELLRLPPGWNHHNARPVALNALRAVIAALTSTMRHDSPAPDVIPLATGGLQLEWHSHQMDIEFAAGHHGELSVYVRDRQTGREWEGDTGVELRLADAIDCLTQRRRQHP
jgi:hypothetical protein